MSWKAARAPDNLPNDGIVFGAVLDLYIINITQNYIEQLNHTHLRVCTRNNICRYSDPSSWSLSNSFDTIRLSQAEVRAVGFHFRVQCKELACRQTELLFNRSAAVSCYDGVPFRTPLRDNFTLGNMHHEFKELATHRWSWTWRSIGRYWRDSIRDIKDLNTDSRSDRQRRTRNGGIIIEICEVVIGHVEAIADRDRFTYLEQEETTTYNSSTAVQLSPWLTT